VADVLTGGPFATPAKEEPAEGEGQDGHSQDAEYSPCPARRESTKPSI
jgi:hypothetical protein